jgi:hypothetical protein
MQTLCMQKNAPIRNLLMFVPRLLLFYRSGNILLGSGNAISSGENVLVGNGKIFCGSEKTFLSGRDVCNCHLRCDATLHTSLASVSGDKTPANW